MSNDNITQEINRKLVYRATAELMQSLRYSLVNADEKHFLRDAIDSLHAACNAAYQGDCYGEAL